MNLDFQQINHNYILRVVIFSVFLFKEHRKTESIYLQQILNFLRKKLGYAIDLQIECGPKFTKDVQRDLFINNILNDIEFEHMNLIVVEFKTPLKSVTLQINLNDEEKYEQYLYS